MSDAPVLASQIRDELEVQAWLARAELRNPSLHDEVSALAQLRDGFRVQLHLGKLEAREEFQAAEARWIELKSRVAMAGEPVVEDLNALIRDIRAGYAKLRS